MVKKSTHILKTLLGAKGRGGHGTSTRGKRKRGANPEENLRRSKQREMKRDGVSLLVVLFSHRKWLCQRQQVGQNKRERGVILLKEKLYYQSGGLLQGVFG